MADAAYPYRHFHEWLRLVLIGVSQHELARKSGVNHGTISRLAKGQDPHLSTVHKLVAAVHG